MCCRSLSLTGHLMARLDVCAMLSPPLCSSSPLPAICNSYACPGTDIVPTIVRSTNQPPSISTRSPADRDRGSQTRTAPSSPNALHVPTPQVHCTCGRTIENQGGAGGQVRGRRGCFDKTMFPSRKFTISAQTLFLS